MEELLLPHLHLGLVVDVDAHVSVERRAVREVDADAALVLAHLVAAGRGLGIMLG